MPLVGEGTPAQGDTALSPWPVGLMRRFPFAGGDPISLCQAVSWVREEKAQLATYCRGSWSIPLLAGGVLLGVGETLRLSAGATRPPGLPSVAGGGWGGARLRYLLPSGGQGRDSFDVSDSARSLLSLGGPAVWLPPSSPQNPLSAASGVS